MKKKVAIIGAGACGIIAIKCCLDEDLEPVCFERTSRIGGLWYYSNDVLGSDHGSVAKSTVINTSKEMMAFSDFPPPKEFHAFMHNTKLMEYFRLYCKQFGLEKHIRFSTLVKTVKKASDYEETGRWQIEVQDIQSGQTTKETFDAILICTGHHGNSKMAHFEGEGRFKGTILHSSAYRNPADFENKKVVVVGIGNSGADTCVDLAKSAADQVYLSTRRGTWMSSLIVEKGLPWDMVSTTRFKDYIFSFLPMSVQNTILERSANQRLDHEQFGIKPKHRILGNHPTSSEGLPHRIQSGRVVVKPDIKQLTETGVEFVDGSKLDDVDTIICATGYLIGYPFLEKGIIDVKDGNRVDLFKYAFPPDNKHPTIACLGLIQPIGAVNPIAELQGRWAARVFKGVTSLPSKEEMWDDVTKKREAMASRYVGSTRHTIQVDWIPFMDEVAEQLGCKPSIGRLMLTDPKLAWKCLTDPCTPYQYRLTGPGQWKGAREAIFTQWERCLHPLRSRTVQRDESPFGVMALIVVVTAILIWFLWRYF